MVYGLQIDILLFTQPCLSFQTLSCFQFFTIINNIEMNTFSASDVFFFLKQYTVSTIATTGQKTWKFSLFAILFAKDCCDLYFQQCTLMH